MNDIKQIAETENKMVILAVTGAQFGRCLDTDKIVAGAGGGNSFFDSLSSPKVVDLTESVIKDQASGKSSLGAMIITSLMVGGAQVAAGAYKDPNHSLRKLFRNKGSELSTDKKRTSNANTKTAVEDLINLIHQHKKYTTPTIPRLMRGERPSPEFSNHVIKMIESICDKNMQNIQNFERDLLDSWDVLYPNDPSPQNTDLRGSLRQLLAQIDSELTQKISTPSPISRRQPTSDIASILQVLSQCQQMKAPRFLIKLKIQLAKFISVRMSDPNLDLPQFKQDLKNLY